MFRHGVFAMFFIIIPLTSSILLKGKEGSMFRLMANACKLSFIAVGKSVCLPVVCFFQTVLMILAGCISSAFIPCRIIVLGTHISPLVVMTIVSALAALGLWVMLASSQNTSAGAASGSFHHHHGSPGWTLGADLSHGAGYAARGNP